MKLQTSYLQPSPGNPKARFVLAMVSDENAFSNHSPQLKSRKVPNAHLRSSWLKMLILKMQCNPIQGWPLSLFARCPRRTPAARWGKTQAQRSAVREEADVVNAGRVEFRHRPPRRRRLCLLCFFSKKRCPRSGVQIDQKSQLVIDLFITKSES